MGTQITLTRQEQISESAINLTLRIVLKLFIAKKKMRNREALRSLSMEMSGAYENIELKTVHPKNARNGTNRALLTNFGRGVTKNRTIQKIIPRSHEICVAAMECGADNTIKMREPNASRSSKRGTLFCSLIPARLSNCVRNFCIGMFYISAPTRREQQFVRKLIWYLPNSQSYSFNGARIFHDILYFSL